MWTSMARFEMGYHLRQPLFYLVTLLFSIFVFMWGTSDGAGRAVGKIHLNAPLVTMELLTKGSLLGLFVVTVFVASSAIRDFDRHTAPLFLSKPVSRFDYLMGRFAGSMAVSALMYLICTLTLAVSSRMPGLDPARLGPFDPWPYLFTLGVLILPNLFSLGATFYALAIWTRSTLVTLLGVVGFFGIYTLAMGLMSNLGSEGLGAMLDPFGLAALGSSVKYWTVSEINSAVPQVSGLLLYNRLLWLAVGVMFLGICLLTFDPSRSPSRRQPRRRMQDETADDSAADTSQLPTATRTFTPSAVLRLFLHQTGFEAGQVIRSIPFLVILVFGLVVVAGEAMSAGQMFGTSVHPRTHLMLEAIRGGYAILLVIIATLYSGELIWKERSLGMADVYDSLPAANGVYLGAKLLALWWVMAIFLAVGVAVTLGFQLWSGYPHLELGLYAKGATYLAVYPLLMCCLACFFQIAARSKFAGYGLVIFFMMGWDFLEEFDLRHHLYRFGSVPELPYSEMNGYGHFEAPFLWTSLYWACGAAVLLGWSILLWKRGTDLSWKTRWREAKARWRGPVRGWVGLAAFGFVATGSWIFYNTNVLNPYLPEGKLKERLAAYETTYGRYKDIDLPRIIGVKAEVDIYPAARRVEIRGLFQLRNKGERPIDELHISWPRRVRVQDLRLPPHRVAVEDEALGYTVIRLDEPFDPGEDAELGFDVVVEHRGFVNHGSNTSIVANGTYFNNRDYFPTLGYSVRKQLVDGDDRRRHGLDPVHRFAAIDDDFARRNTPRGADADWLSFETTVSTSAEQIAIAPGNLERQWVDGDRRYFHYKSEAPMPFHFAYLSAKYEVRRDRWKDVDVEIYHHPDHSYNIDRMVDSVKKSLDYFTENFGPYQFRQVRIVEFPGYTKTARAFPNTIAFSESIGFIARIDDDAIDYPFYVTAHELAHQWWSHQVIGGDVQGVAMLAETMAQYSALMVMEKEYGAEKMRRFLKYELDSYLRSRGGEQGEEMPLARVEEQDYIFYHKGSVVMYALKDYLGEANLNRSIAEFVSKVAFQEPPFTTTTEFLDTIRRGAPDGAEALINDLFETITLFDNRVAEATYAELENGSFRVWLDLEAEKLRADGEGTERQIPLDDWIDIAVFGEPAGAGETGQSVLFFEKRHITENRLRVEVVVEERPVAVGFDPYNKLVDRDSDDNLRGVSEARGSLQAGAAR